MAVLAVAVGGAMAASGVASLAGAAATATFVGMTAAQWGFMAGSVVGNLLFTENPNGPRLDDKKVQGQGYGAPIWKGWGTIRGAGQLIWSGDLIEHADQQGKGKRGGNVYSYSVDCAIAICEGEISDVLRVWANGILIYNANGTTKVDSEVISETSMTVYTGSETQAPSAMIEGYLGAGNVPAYRGTAYVTFEGLALEKFGNRIPSFEFEVANGTLEVDGITSRTLKAAKNLSFGSGYFCRIHDGWLVGTETNNLHRYAFDGTLVHTYVLPHLANKKIITDAVALPGGNISYAWTFGAGGYLTFIDLTSTSNYFSSISRPEFGEITDIISSSAQNACCWFLNGSNYNVYVGAVDYLNPPWLGPKAFSMGNVNKVCFDHLGMAYGTKDNGTGASFFWRSSGPSIFDRTIITPDVNAGAIIDVAIDPATNYIMLAVFNASASQNSGIYFLNLDLSRAGFLNIHPVINRQARFFTDGTNWFFGCEDMDQPGRPIVVEFSASRMEVVREYNFDTSDTPATWTCTPFCLDPRNGGLYMTSMLQDTGSVLGPDGYISSRMALNFWKSGGNNVLGSPTDLRDVVTDIMLGAGLSSSEFDASALAGNVVRGYMRGRTMSARAALEPLQAAWYFDAPEIDWQIKAIPRGGPVEAAVTYENLLVLDGQYGPTVDVTRKQDLDLPKQITVAFKDVAADYDAGTQDARREATNATGKATIELPIVFTATEARQRALAAMSMMWMGRDTVRFAVSTKYLRLNPASPLTVELQDGSQRRVVIQSMNADQQHIEIDAVFDDVSNYYQEDATGADRETLPPPDPIASVSPSGLILLDVPLLRDSDDVATPVHYWAAYPIAPAEKWPGSVLFKSADGVNYNNQASTTAKPTWGYAKGTLAPFYGGDVFDEINTIDVELSNGTLASASQLSVLNGANLAVIGKEIFQFRDATLLSGMTWRLSGLLRGRRNSEYAIFTHGVLERFLLLTTATVDDFTVPLSDVNNARQYKPVTTSQPIADAAAISFTSKGMTLRPVSPVLINSTETGGDITITWTRRTRVGGSWADYIDVPVSETAQAYEIDIWDAGFTQRKRVLTSSGPSVVYAAADAAADFGATPATFGVRVYQISDKVGRGCPGRAVLPGGQTIPEEPDNSSSANPPT